MKVNVLYGKCYREPGNWKVEPRRSVAVGRGSVLTVAEKYMEECFEGIFTVKNFSKQTDKLFFIINV